MKILIVLAGSPPSKTLLKTEMSAADLVIAVDGGFNVFGKYKLTPDLLLGDLDSVDMGKTGSLEVHHLLDQDQTDLQKTIYYVLQTYAVKSFRILGAGGLRTDHLLHNLHICASIESSISVTFNNEIGVNAILETIQRITPQCEFDLRVNKGTTLSILPIASFKGLNSFGLHWEIVDQDRSESFISQSNRSIVDDPRFRIDSGCAYIAVYQ